MFYKKTAVSLNDYSTLGKYPFTDTKQDKDKEYRIYLHRA